MCRRQKSSITFVFLKRIGMDKVAETTVLHVGVIFRAIEDCYLSILFFASFLFSYYPAAGANEHFIGNLKHSLGRFEDVQKTAFEFIRKAVSDFLCASEAASAVKISGNCEQSENMSFCCV